jgi:lysophospholipase L1-like esterase
MRALRIATLVFALFLCGKMSAVEPQNWVASWASSPMELKLPKPAGDSTFLDIVHLSLGGDAFRITLTNEFGLAPLRVDNVHVALVSDQGAARQDTDRPLTFDSQTSVLIPAGGTVTSDPVQMRVQAISDLAVSIYLAPQEVAVPTCHESAISTNYIFNGNQTTGAAWQSGTLLNSWCFLKNVQVHGGKDAATIIAFGDSITDGAHSTVGTNHRWPDYLAARLQANKKTSHIAVVNEGIGGNRILFNGHGPSAASREDRDVIAQPGVKYLVLLEGINDIDQTINPDSAESKLTVQELTSAVAQIVQRAHQHNIKVFGATLTPNGGAKRVTPHVNELRNGYNEWLRTSGVVDKMIDFDVAVRDPEKFNELLPANDSGDHLHPSDAGYKAMADSIDLTLFQ